MPRLRQIAIPPAPAELGTILLTGATGYVGGRLLERLVQEGCRVRCLTRRPETLARRVARDVEIVAGDLLELESLTVALAGVQIAYHLPGRLWLQFDVEDDGRRTELRQTTVFDPAGSVGLVYWYLLYITRSSRPCF